ncbi:MAG: diacylglyceryl transferase [Bacteroidota bacterium]|jgi:prolipoprotein diacylglyceryl transferase|nr:diacylglyceryl transferase [Bacteroidota bacterium]
MYPSLYYAFKDLFNIDLPFLKMIQMFGFFVAVAFIYAAYVWTKELKRKEEDGLIGTTTQKILKGQKATTNELVTAGIIGFILGFKLLYIAFNFSAFLEDTQGFILSTQGNLLGGILCAAAFIYFKYKEKEKTRLDEPVWEQEIIHPYQQVGNLTLIAAFAGILGAKIFHNLENWDEFMADPIEALMSFSGLTMYGGLILASVACIWYGTKQGIKVTHLIDSAAPSLMLGYGIGRIGCHVSGDGDWGIPSLNPKPFNWMPDWMWSYDYPHNVVSEGVPLPGCEGRFCTHLDPSVYPTAFYEVVMCISLFFVIWAIRKRITTPGVLFSIYLIFNGVERFFIEKIRVNTLYHVNGFGFTQAELISTLLFFTGVFGIWYFRRKNVVRSV